MHHPKGAKTAEFVFNSTKECRPNVCRLKLQDGGVQSEELLFSCNNECCNFLHYNLRAHSAIMTNRCCHTVIAPHWILCKVTCRALPFKSLLVGFNLMDAGLL